MGAVGKSDEHHRRAPRRRRLGSADDAELQRLYDAAMDLQQQQPPSRYTIKELRRIKARVEELMSPAARPRSSGSFVPYPSVQDPAFPGVIARKKEFAQSAVPPVRRELGVQQLWDERCNSGEFMLTPNQQLLKNFMSPHTPYNGLFMFHGVGVGKTCAAVTIAEQFPDHRALVLTPAALQDSFVRNVFDTSKLSMTAEGSLDVARASNQCTGMGYISQLAPALLSDRAAMERHLSAVRQVQAQSPQPWQQRWATTSSSDAALQAAQAHVVRPGVGMGGHEPACASVSSAALCGGGGGGCCVLCAGGGGGASATAAEGGGASFSSRGGSQSSPATMHLYLRQCVRYAGWLGLQQVQRACVGFWEQYAPMAALHASLATASTCGLAQSPATDCAHAVHVPGSSNGHAVLSRRSCSDVDDVRHVKQTTLHLGGAT